MRIFLAGHQGLAGSAILRALQTEGRHEVLTLSRRTLDLTHQGAVTHFFQSEDVDCVIIAAAKVGGIMANMRQPAAFLYDNLMIAANIIQAAHRADVQHLIQLGSSCIYPRDAPQPIRENALLTGPLEPSNTPYALAKIAAIKLCESYRVQYGRDYRSLMPTNLYGPNDNFHTETAHVIPALINRFHAAAQSGARQVTLWGTGTPKREFLHVDDLADAVLFLRDLPRETYAAATTPFQSHLNVGTGQDITILDLARRIAGLCGYHGSILTDPAKPDGTPRKCLDVGAMSRLGWAAQIGLDEGLAQTCAWYQTAQTSGARLRA